MTKESKAKKTEEEENVEVTRKELVVRELPTVSQREVQLEEGTYTLLTVEEAIQEILESVREIKSKIEVVEE